MGNSKYALVQPAVDQSDLTTVAKYMLSLMLRNVAADGFVFTDPVDPTQFSAPGCILASPSFRVIRDGTVVADLSSINQDYVFNWTRDAAVTAIEIARARQPNSAKAQALTDFVNFARTCQLNAFAQASPGQQAIGMLAKACYTIEGQPRQGWPEQNDGPALQTLALLAAHQYLDRTTQATASEIIGNNVNFILSYHQNANFNLWEETAGHSFFTRSVQLSCLQEVRANTFTIPIPDGIDAVIAALQTALQSHWNGEFYVSIIDPVDPLSTRGAALDSDVILAANYGSVSSADPRLLATAAKLRDVWTSTTAAASQVYPINAADDALGLGPLIGRYPDDTYDGDADPADDNQQHPWPLCTAGLAQLYYAVASSIKQSGAVPFDDLSAPFFAQVLVDITTSATDAANRLLVAGDSMLRAIVYHSDHLELSEQFDGTTGYEKSVRNLTWSYAAFLSAVRARTALGS